MSGEDVISSMTIAATNGLLSPDVRDPRTPEERAEHNSVKEEATKIIYHWLRTHEAPIYDNRRETCLVVGEVLDLIRNDHPEIENNRMTKGLARAIIEGESTGWGLVASSDGKRFYAKKAVLLSFRRNQDQSQYEDQDSQVA